MPKLIINDLVLEHVFVMVLFTFIFVHMVYHLFTEFNAKVDGIPCVITAVVTMLLNATFVVSGWITCFTPVKGENVPISMQVMLASFIMGCFSFVLCIMLSEEHQELI